MRPTKILNGGQPFEDFDAVDKFHLNVTTRKAMNFRDDIPSIPIHRFIDHYVLVVELTSMQDVTKSIQFPERIEESLMLELNLTFPLEHVNYLIVLGERISSVSGAKIGVVSSKSVS